MTTIQDKTTHRILGNVIQATYGKSSEHRHPTYFITMQQLTDDLVRCRFMMIVNFGHDGVMFEKMKVYKEEALAQIKEEIKYIADQYKKAAKEYKDRGELTQLKTNESDPKSSIKLTVIDIAISDNIEYVSASISSPLKRAYYKLALDLKLE